MSAITKINVGGTNYDVGGTQIVTASGKTSLQAVTNLTPSYPGTTRGNGAVDLQMYRNSDTQIASGYYSVAMGYCNTVSGYYSVAMGRSNTTSDAYSVAIGDSNTASGYASVAMGESNGASGNYSVAMGYLNTASGAYSVAMGHSNTASDESSVAMGSNNTASGLYSVAMGGYNTASGSYSVAMGYLSHNDNSSVTYNLNNTSNCCKSGCGYLGKFSGDSSIQFLITEITDCYILNVHVLTASTQGACTIYINGATIVRFTDNGGPRTLSSSDFTIQNGNLVYNNGTQLLTQIGCFYTRFAYTGTGSSSSSGS